MPSYNAKRAIARARKASRAIKNKFYRFLLIAGKEKVKSRFFNEYRAYQDFEANVALLERQAKAGKARVGREVAEDITRMELFEEKQLLKDHAEVHEDISKSRKKLEGIFIASYATMCLGLISGLVKAARSGFADGVLRHPLDIAAGFVITAITLLLYKAVEKYNNAAERMQQIAVKRHIFIWLDETRPEKEMPAAPGKAAP